MAGIQPEESLRLSSITRKGGVNMLEIYNYIENNKSQMYKLLKEIVEHESPSDDKEALDQLALWISEKFEELTGSKAEIIQNKYHGNHVRGEFGSGERQLLVLAHFDTVWPKGTLQKIPYSEKDGVAHGPGIFDMKGGLIQGLFAVHALYKLNKQLNKKIVFLFNSDEEIGSPTSQPLIEEEAKKSDAVFVLEPAISNAGSLKTERKGVGIFNIEVEGIPAHSGIDPEKGRSAIEELAHQIIYLHSLTDFETGTTINVGTINGGSRSNVIAEKAYAELDLRVKKKTEFDRVIPLIENLSPKVEGTTIKVTGGINRMPMEKNEAVEEMFQTAKAFAAEYFDFELTEMETGGGSDGNFTSPFAPTLDGLGAVGDGAHANHEFLILDEMPKRSALFAMLLFTYGKGEDGNGKGI
jgi:glutamate carboxypeptidase